MASATRRALDHLRRRRMLERKHAMIASDLEDEQQAMPDLDSALDDDIGDEMLRLVFTRLSPAAFARGPRGSCTADDLRPDNRGDRQGLPPADSDDRSADRAREADPF